jgi:hypothetical protein
MNEHEDRPVAWLPTELLLAGRTDGPSLSGLSEKMLEMVQMLCAISSFSSNFNVESTVSIATTPRKGSIDCVDIEIAVIFIK